MIRQPAVAGTFYPADQKALDRSLEFCLSGTEGVAKVRARACLVPHAGYAYSGPVAGAVYQRMQLPSRFVVLCPRHYPVGQLMAVMSEGEWFTPLGPARIDEDLARRLKRACSLLREDAAAHKMEHSLEVQLPFLQKLAGRFTFVPVALGTLVLAALEELGRALAQVVAEEKQPVLIVSTSDMNHYESDSVTRKKDEMAIERILALDPRGLYQTVRQQDIRMCGFGPAVTMLTAALQLGATRAELVRYSTSGDVTGDRESVVGYAGVIVQ